MENIVDGRMAVETSIEGAASKHFSDRNFRMGDVVVQTTVDTQTV